MTNHLTGGLVAEQSRDGLEGALIGSLLLTRGQDDPVGLPEAQREGSHSCRSLWRRWRSREETYLVHRMTFSPLAVSEMFLAQTGTSGGGLGRGGGSGERAPEGEEEEVQPEGNGEEAQRSDELGRTPSILLFFSFSSSSTSSSSWSSHNPLL